MEDYAAFSQLKTLPKLVRQQRRLESQIAPLAPLCEDEKAVRKSIDLLLVAAGITKGDGVTCLGYDVVHNERKGQTSVNTDAAAVLLVLGGVDPEFVDFVITACTERGDPAKFATVKPSRGAKVRTA